MQADSEYLIAFLSTMIDDAFLKKFQKTHGEIWTTDRMYFKEEYQKGPTISIKQEVGSKLAVIKPDLRYKYDEELAEFRFTFMEKLANTVLKGMK